MTDAGRQPRSKLGDRRLDGAKVRRQRPLGPDVADFFRQGQKLVIEVDGSQHFDRAEADRHWTDRLERHGCRVPRFWNREIRLETDGVSTFIREAPAGVTIAPRRRAAARAPSPRRGGLETLATRA